MLVLKRSRIDLGESWGRDGRVFRFSVLAQSGRVYKRGVVYLIDSSISVPQLGPSVTVLSEPISNIQSNRGGSELRINRNGVATSARLSQTESIYLMLDANPPA